MEIRRLVSLLCRNFPEEATFSAVSEGVRPYALDPDRAKALWAKSEEMVGERF